MPEQIPAPSASWVIGSARGCDILLDQPVVSANHCRLTVYGDRFVLEDLGSTNGTFVNGHRLQPQGPVYVSPQDQITLGRTLAMPWPADGRSGPSRPAAPHAITIGRNPASDVHLDYGMISWDHARIVPEGKGWIIEDLSSANGTALNRLDNKIQRAPLQPSDEIYLGSYRISAARILQKKHITQGEGAFELVRFGGDQMVLGRDPESDYPLDYPMISWRHAMLRRAPEGIYVSDLGSRNGTYVNGIRITGRALVRPGQEIGLGSFRFQLLEDGALAKRAYTGNVTIEASQVAVNAPNGDRLLDPVSLTVFPSELVALMGPAGAGKTTFLKALNGYTRPAAGRVLFNGADLYQFYDRFRQQMSYVPQDDIVHPQLTVGEALYFSARLRTDLTDAEIERRIVKVLDSLDILEKKDTVIGSPERKVLSGGQRKRVNIAMELINDTPVIFLDEPTSGLSSADAEGVILLLKKLSAEGKTIVTTIHQPSLDIFKQFDSLIMISRDKGGRGALAYFGPAHPESIEFFEPEGAREVRRQPGRDLNPEMLLSGLKKKNTADWAASYERSKYKKLFVEERSGKIPSTPTPDPNSTVRGFGFTQWWTLVGRNLILKKRDRAQSAILLLQAPVFAILLGAVFNRLKLAAVAHASARNDQQWHQQLQEAAAKFFAHISGIEFLLVVAAVWFGCNNVARDVVGEWTVFQRERMVTLKLPSYVFSKLAIAATLSLFQCLALLCIVTWICGLQASFFSVLGILYLSSLVGSAIGLCVSARASTTEAAIAMLPLILLPIIALGGGIRPIKDLPETVKSIAKAVPSRWALEATLRLEAKQPHADLSATNATSADADATDKAVRDIADDRYPPAEQTPLPRSFAILAGMLVFWLSVALVFLRMRDIQ
jgi:ABC-type multidrug transport system ATPase subunit/pSer/pThr/pTyr-binding forkhead associated (FHA) protein